MIEQPYLIVEESVSEQHPVGHCPSYQLATETTERKWLKTVRLKQPEHREEGELGKENAPCTDKQERVEQISWRLCLLVTLEQEIDGE